MENLGIWCHRGGQEFSMREYKGLPNKLSNLHYSAETPRGLPKATEQSSKRLN